MLKTKYRAKKVKNKGW